MMQILIPIISFAAGITVGLQIYRITSVLKASLEALRAAQKVEHKKNTGVVRPGLTQPLQSEPVAEHRSAVVRPRLPQEADPNETNAALQSARNRTQPK